jgi:hypothetical protein
MKQIPLTRGKFALVDDVDYERLIQTKWQAKPSTNTWYAKTTSPSPEKHTIYMHL